MTLSDLAFSYWFAKVYETSPLYKAAPANMKSLTFSSARQDWESMTPKEQLDAITK